MYGTMEEPEIGSVAPDFTLRGADGKDVKLSDYRARTNVLLAFYRGAADAFSMRWLARLNDDYLFFRSLGTEILAVSPDSVRKAAYSADRYKIFLKLLADPLKSVIEEYRVQSELGGVDPAVFIIDPSGRIRYRYTGKAPEDLPSNDKLMKSIQSIS